MSRRYDDVHERRQFSHAWLARVLRAHSSRDVELIRKRIREEFVNSVSLQTEFSEFLSRGVRWIEAGATDSVNLTVPELVKIAELWDVPLTRLFACAPEAGTELCICVGNEEHYSLHSSYWQSIPGSPENAEYRFPTTRLRNAEDVEIGQVVLEAGGCSECHSHYGDECIFVRRGNVELRLLDTDVRNRLSEGDVVHFYAEQRHVVHNTGDGKAEILILRHNAALDDTLRVRSLPASPGKWSEVGVKRLIKELESTLSFEISAREGMPERIHDRMGLGYLLETLSQTDAHGGTLQEIANRCISGPSVDNTPGFNRQLLNRMQLGEAAVDRTEIPILADAYRVAPILLYEFLFPAYRNVIVIRGDEGLRSVGNEFLEEVAGGARYGIPVRRLAAFGISMSHVTLPSGSRINEHQHPKHELLIPVNGDLSISFAGGANVAVSAKHHAYAHFHSDQMHSMRNPSDEDAVFWVMRFC